MPISRTDVEKIAELARLELTEPELESFTKQLGSILSHIEKLNELDTTDVEPMTDLTGAGEDAGYTMREDETIPSLGQQVAVANAPDAEAGYFKVPKVIGES